MWKVLKLDSVTAFGILTSSVLFPLLFIWYRSIKRSNIAHQLKTGINQSDLHGDSPLIRSKSHDMRKLNYHDIMHNRATSTSTATIYRIKNLTSNKLVCHTTTDDIKQTIRCQVMSIIEANPWLCGKLITEKEDNHGKPTSTYLSIPKDSIAIQAYAKKCFDHVIVDNIAYELQHSPSRFLCKNGNALLDKEEEPLWKVTLLTMPTTSINNTVNNMTKFALVVSMAHVLGDGATFYRIYGMLNCVNDNTNITNATATVTTPGHSHKDISSNSSSSSVFSLKWYHSFEFEHASPHNESFVKKLLQEDESSLQKPLSTQHSGDSRDGGGGNNEEAERISYGWFKTLARALVGKFIPPYSLLSPPSPSSPSAVPSPIITHQPLSSTSLTSMGKQASSIRKVFQLVDPSWIDTQKAYYSSTCLNNNNNSSSIYPHSGSFLFKTSRDKSGTIIEDRNHRPKCTNPRADLIRLHPSNQQKLQSSFMKSSSSFSNFSPPFSHPSFSPHPLLPTLPEKTSTSLTNCAFVSTNDILVSTLMPRNANVKIAVDMRERIEEYDNNGMGNYSARLTLGPKQHINPQVVRKCITQKLNKERFFDTSQVDKEEQQPEDQHNGLSSLTTAATDNRLSMLTNWSSFYQQVDFEQCEFLTHFPLICPIQATKFASYVGRTAIVFKLNKQANAVLFVYHSEEEKEATAACQVIGPTIYPHRCCW